MRLPHFYGVFIVYFSVMSTACHNFFLEPSGNPVEKIDLNLDDLDFKKAEDPNEVTSIRKLTRSEYQTVIIDLFNVDESALRSILDQLPREDSGFGFTNIQTMAHYSVQRLDSYHSIANDVAKLVFESPNFQNMYMKCEYDCRFDEELFISQIGSKLHRRPLDAELSSIYFRLYQQLAGEDKSKIIGVLAAMLQSPHFLFFTSNPDSLDGYDVVEKLALLLWRSAPDQALLTKAKGLDANNKEVIRALAESMIADDRALRGIQGFFTEWLSLDVLDGVIKDRNVLGSEINDDYFNDAKQEVLLLLEDIWKSGRDFKSFLDSDVAFVSPALASVYGIANNATDGFQKVDISANDKRFGFLSTAAFSSILSNGYVTTPTARGLYVMRKFLCEEVPPPPPGLGAFEVMLKDFAISPREKMAIHAADRACIGCHELMDPIGMGLENYNAVGRFRLDYTSTNSDINFGDKLIDVANSIKSNGTEKSFATPRELSQTIKDDSRLDSCFATHFYEYASGQVRNSDESDDGVERIKKVFRDSKGNLKSTFLEAALKIIEPKNSEKK